MLNPLPAVSIAVTVIFVPLKESSQQEPQLGELKPAIAWAPPMKGKVGSEPNVVKFLVSRPLDPVEHSTVSRDCIVLGQ